MNEGPTSQSAHLPAGRGSADLCRSGDRAGASGGGNTRHACDGCLARPWLLGRLAGNLDVVRNRIAALLQLSDADLIAAVAGAQQTSVRRELAGFDAAAARKRAARAELELICRCHPDYPAPLAALAAPPAVLHVAGGLDRFLSSLADQPIAIVGARRASGYGLEVAGALGRGLGAAGVTVLSGMALGIDSAAHAGALASGGRTIAVLPGGADRPYPPSRRALRQRIERAGSVVAELPPGTPVRRWMFPARNRIIAALAAMTVVVEATEASGALITADHARALGRPVGAVPGHVGSRLASGPHRMLTTGAALVGGPQDVLDVIYGSGVRRPPVDGRPSLPAEQLELLEAVRDGHDTPSALARAGFVIEPALAALASLELAGYLIREAGGRFTPLA